MWNYIGIWLTMCLGCFLVILTYLTIKRIEKEEWANFTNTKKTFSSEPKDRMSKLIEFSEEHNLYDE